MEFDTLTTQFPTSVDVIPPTPPWDADQMQNRSKSNSNARINTAIITSLNKTSQMNIKKNFPSIIEYKYETHNHQLTLMSIK